MELQRSQIRHPEIADGIKIAGSYKVNQVIVAETDHLVNYAISKTLQSCNVGIKTVSTGQDLLTAIDSFFYSLCIFDTSVPGICGTNILRTIKEASPDTEIIMITTSASSDNGAYRKPVGEGLCHCLSKPFEISELKAMVKLTLNDDTDQLQPIQRRAARSSVRKLVSYTVTVVELGRPTSVTLNGHLVDICEHGLGMRTHYPLEPGHLLLFNRGIDKSSGVVRWSAMHEESSMYHVGVEFLAM